MQGPSEAELSAFGFLPDDLGSTAVPVWPDNLPAINALIALSTQWRVGAAGPIGLDYNVLPAVFRLQGIHRSAWPDVFECLRVLEAEALDVMSEEK